MLNQETVVENVTSTVTDMVIPVDVRAIGNFNDLRLSNPTNTARLTLIRQIATAALDEEWNNVTPLLAPNGDYAGGAQFAHAIVCDRLFQAREDEFTAVGDVTLRELWPVTHDLLKRRGLVFSGGFVTGMRQR